MQLRLFDLDEQEVRTREPSECEFAGRRLKDGGRLKNECLLHGYWTNCIDIDECMDDSAVNMHIRNRRNGF